MELHSGLPYWLVKNALYDHEQHLSNDISADVVIIGAGITGALAAHELCEAGLNVCILEKESIACGSSAASTALLQYEIDVPLCRMIPLIGEENSVTAYKGCLQAITDIERVMIETGVEADFQRRSSVFYASDEEGQELIEEEIEVRRKYGLPVQMLDKDELKEKYWLSVDHSGLVNKESAQMDAHKAATGLIRHHIMEHALQLFTHTEVMGWVKTGDGYIVKTRKGATVKCKYIVLACGFDAGRFLPEKVMNLTSTYAMVSRPIEPQLFWPERCLIWETAEPYLYVRTVGNRILVGGEDEDFNNPERRDEHLREKVETLEAKFRLIMPNVPISCEMIWCGTFSTTKDGLPFIGAHPDTDENGVFYDLGYGGNGITFSMIGAQIIRNMITGKGDPRYDTFNFARIAKYW